MLPFLASAGGAALIGGAATLINGAANRRAADRAYNRNDIRKTVRDAEAAGVHPLEALRSGYANQKASQGPRISTMGVAANAVAQAAQLYRDGLAAEQRSEMIDAQIKNIEADTERMGSVATYSGTVPRLGQYIPQAETAERPDYIDPRDRHSQQNVKTAHGDRTTYRGDELDERFLSWWDETAQAAESLASNTWQYPRIAGQYFLRKGGEAVDAVHSAPMHLGAFLARTFHNPKPAPVRVGTQIPNHGMPPGRVMVR